MNVLSVENLTKSYGITTLFENLSFGIEKGQKVALVARNGAGKSTLMRILTGLEVPDSGTVTFNKEIRVGFLSQQHDLDDSLTILQNIFVADNEMTRAIAAYELAIEKNDERMVQKAHDSMDRTGAWDYESKARQILGQLDIHDLERIVGELSGGQQRRIALAQVLILEPDVLLLDEPTNHLDLDMIEWLEDYLGRSTMTIVMVTHDRYFLENITDEILELENKQIYRYRGNFSYYLDKKASREANEEVTQEKTMNLFKRELAWSRKMPRARTTKSKSRMGNFQELKESIRKESGPDSLELEININRMGSKIVEMHKVKKSYGKTIVLDGFDYVFKTGEKIGLVGKNGTGKTTFLNLITQKIEPDGGKIVVGETVAFGYYSQLGLQLKEDLRLLESVREIADFIPLAKGKTITAAQMLERFMFPKHMHFNQVGSLSGGEKKRLLLLMILMKNPNFLILDEPTNDLDVFTLTVLEEYLLQFPGCLMIVSHDRYFLDKLIDHVFVLDGHGHVRDIIGNYNVYRNEMEAMETRQNALQKVEKKSNAKDSQPKTKLSFKEKFELETLEKELPALEEKKKKLEEKLASGLNDHKELIKTTEELGKISYSLDVKTMRWLELSEFQ